MLYEHLFELSSQMPQTAHSIFYITNHYYYEFIVYEKEEKVLTTHYKALVKRTAYLFANGQENKDIEDEGMFEMKMVT